MFETDKDALRNWCILARDILIEYRKKADAHWAHIGQYNRNDRFGVSKFQYRNDRYDLDIQASRKHTKELIDLMEKSINLNFLPLPSICTNKTSREQVVMWMYVYLANYLCSYFRGRPRQENWEKVVALSRKIGALPGDAFFNKLIGDIYRNERRKWSRPQYIYPEMVDRHEDLEQLDPKKMKGIIVMSFTPVILISDPLDLLNVPRPIDYDDLIYESDLREFVREVELLSGRYMRYQMWRYLFDSNFPIFYGVSQWSLCQIIEQLAGELVLLKWKYFQNVPFKPWEITDENVIDNERLTPDNRAQISKYLRERDDPKNSYNKRTFTDDHHNVKKAIKILEKDFSNNREEWLKNIEEAKRALLSASDIRAEKFFSIFSENMTSNYNSYREVLYSKTKMPCRRIVVFTEQETIHKGLTSQVLGQEDGIRATPSRRSGGWEECCFWAEGLPIAVEREYLKNRLWQPFFVNPNDSARWLEPNNVGNARNPFAGFSSHWWKTPE